MPSYLWPNKPRIIYLELLDIQDEGTTFLSNTEHPSPSNPVSQPRRQNLKFHIIFYAEHVQYSDIIHYPRCCYIMSIQACTNKQSQKPSELQHIHTYSIIHNSLFHVCYYCYNTLLAAGIPPLKSVLFNIRSRKNITTRQCSESVEIWYREEWQSLCHITTIPI